MFNLAFESAQLESPVGEVALTEVGTDSLAQLGAHRFDTFHELLELTNSPVIFPRLAGLEARFQACKSIINMLCIVLKDWSLTSRILLFL